MLHCRAFCNVIDLIRAYSYKLFQNGGSVYQPTVRTQRLSAALRTHGMLATLRHGLCAKCDCVMRDVAGIINSA